MDATENNGNGTEPSKLASDVGSGIAGDKGYIDPKTARGNPAIEPPAATGEQPTERRKRGRPSNAERIARGERVGNTASAGGSAATGKKKAPVSINVSAIEKILLSVHTSLAIGLKTPEFMLDPKEAEQLAEALATVQAQYGFEMDPKTAAWFNLLTVAGTVYGSRAVAIYIRQSATPKPQAPNAPAQEPRKTNGNGFAFDPANIKLDQ